MVEGGNSQAIYLARRDLEREASECYKGYEVRSKLKRVPKEAVKCNVLMREEEVRSFPFWYIESVKSPGRCVLRSNCEMCDAFRAHFCDRFARCLDLSVQEFRSYLADFLCLQDVKAASCDGLFTECKVCDTLKQVGHNKSPGLDGLFNQWFAQRAISGSITKSVITLLKKSGRHVWKGLDDYRPITLLNTELKILAQVLVNHLQLVISDLIGLEQNCTVKGRSIQDNWHLVHEVLERIKDGTEAVLINLDQSKAFDRVDCVE